MKRAQCGHARPASYRSLLAVLVAVAASVGLERAQAAPGVVETVRAGSTFQVHYAVTFSADELTVRQVDGYDVVRLADGAALAEAGQPLLPTQIVHIALPAGMQVTGVRVVQTQSVALSGEYTLYPAQPPRPISRPATSADFVPPDPATYAATTPFPAELARFLHQTDLTGQELAVLELRPVQYVPAQKQLILHTTLDILLDGTDGYRCAAGLSPHLSPQGRTLAEQTVAALVVNPADLELGAAPLSPQAVPPADSPLSVRGVAPGDYDYVIITPSGWIAAFQPLADWRTKKGLRATIVTTDWIYNAGYTGTNVDQIRAFVADAYWNWGAVYFLLGGDTDTVPCHYRTITAGGETDDIPNDTYYADLGSNWTCDLNVGRAAVRSTAAITNFIAKVLTYEKNPPATNYGKTAFFCGFDLDASTPSELSKDTIKTAYLPADWTYRKVYDSDAGTHKSAVIAALNQGNNLVNHSDHASTNYMGTGYTNHGQGLANADMSNLTNGQRQSILYSIGCYPCDYASTTCIAEAFVQNAPTHGGGLAFVGNSRYGWYNPGSNNDTLSARFDRYFFAFAFGTAPATLGACFSGHKNMGYQSGDVYQWIFTELTLLGDPALPILTDDPHSLAVTHASSLPVNVHTDFAVQVQSGGSPVAGATVCLLKSGDVYAVGQTNAAGVATLGVTPTSTGSVYVTVTKRNYLPYEAAATVYVGGLVTLTVNIAGGGQVTADPPGGAYAPQTSVQLTARGDVGWAFGHWQGALSGSANPATILMDNDKTVTAVFETDCNHNGIPDALDLAAGTSADCNSNGVPDECDLADCDGSPWCRDCNGNGILDACDLVGHYEAASPQYTPLGYPTVQTFTLTAPPETTSDVLLTFSAVGDIFSQTKHVNVSLNGQAVGTAYGHVGYYSCVPDQLDTLTVPMATYDALRASGGGNVAIAMSPTSNMNPTVCGMNPTTIQVTVTYSMAPHSQDANSNGIPDECEHGACCSAGGSCAVVAPAACAGTYEGDGTACTTGLCLPRLCSGDMNCDGAVTFADIDRFVEALSGESVWTHAPCPWLNGDCNGDGGVTFADIDAFVALIGTTCP